MQNCYYVAILSERSEENGLLKWEAKDASQEAMEGNYVRG
jgi:hypothetical protein